MSQTFDITAGFRPAVLGRMVIVRVQVRAINAEDPETILRKEAGFSFLSINGRPRVDPGTLGSVIELTPNDPLSYRPGKMYGLLKLLTHGLSKALEREANSLL